MSETAAKTYQYRVVHKWKDGAPVTERFSKEEADEFVAGWRDGIGEHLEFYRVERREVSPWEVVEEGLS